MPELPEVETIVRGLKEKISGKTIQDVRILHAKPLGQLSERMFRDFIINEKILSIQRFGKYIHFTFVSGKSLISHLRMTGKYIYLDTTASVDLNEQHIRIIFTFSDQSCLLYKDLRIFGTIKTYQPGEIITEKNKVGIEPLSVDLTTEWLLLQLKNKNAPIKNVLLDQSIIAGLGNIYACEALFDAGINPFKKANQLSHNQLTTLIDSIQKIINLAIRYNGTSIRDFRDIDAKSGEFQKLLQVYQREGEFCLRCRQEKIFRKKLAQRSTFYCPVCQPE